VNAFIALASRDLAAEWSEQMLLDITRAVHYSRSFKMEYAADKATENATFSAIQAAHFGRIALGKES